MTFAPVALVSLLALAGMPQATAPRPAPAGESAAPRTAEAYYQFLLGRLLEGHGDLEGAERAYEGAAAADAGGAEVRAELAGFYARQGRADEAARAAEDALRLDASNTEAHAILGTLYADRVEALAGQPLDAAGQQNAAKAIEHLERARDDRRFDIALFVTLGRLFLIQGNAERAAGVLAELVEREPGVTEASWLLAQAYDGAGRRDEARTVLEDAVAAEPGFYRGVVALAEIYERERRWAPAAEAYARAAVLNPRAPELRVREASARLADGQTEAARDLLERLVAADPTNGYAWYLLADAQRTLEDYDASEASARRLVALEPAGIRGLYALALVFEARHDPRAVVALLESAAGQARAPASRPSQLSPLLVRLASAYQELGQFDRAIATFERARAGAADPRAFDAVLAQAHLAAQRYDTALELARTARDANPDDSRAWRLEAQVLRQSGRVGEAVALLSGQRARFSGDVDVQLALASLLADAGRVAEATGVFDDVERRFPGRVDTAFQRGAAFERRKDYARAEAAFREALSRDPAHAPALNYLGYMLAERGERLDEAIAAIERALEIDPGNPSYQDSLGWAYFKKGQVARAREHVGLAADRLPHNSVVQDHLGDILEASGDLAGAAAAWERALAGDLQDVDRAAIERKLAGVRGGRR
jgi:tetratricopeptide (TPR) repeat protein